MADYSGEWNEYRKIRNVALVVFFGLIPLSWVVRSIFRFSGYGGRSDLDFRSDLYRGLRRHMALPSTWRALRIHVVVQGHGTAVKDVRTLWVTEARERLIASQKLTLVGKGN